MTEDKELIALLQDGDGRVMPSAKIGNPPAVNNFVQNVPAPTGPLEATSEEEILTEVEHNLRTVIDYGNNAIKDLADLASSSEHPRPYEALSTLIKSVTDANMSLAGLRKKNQGGALRAADRFQDPTVDENNGTVLSSVDDILKSLEKERRKNTPSIDVDYEEITDDSD